jgi:endonuclease/exonuclease/phosphatase family metal-dependent hydrolase
MLYVPSMRNGAGAFEDRGNAIVSTERLQGPFAVELPLERQRRVAVGASIEVRTSAGPARIDVVSAHLEPLSSPASLWIFKSPRPRQVASLLHAVESRSRARGVPLLGSVVGGDFNTIQGGADEEAYSMARSWSRSLLREDPRRTHRLGRLDYLFFRFQDGWTASTTRVDEKFGSDHHPVLGRIFSGAGSP